MGLTRQLTTDLPDRFGKLLQAVDWFPLRHAWRGYNRTALRADLRAAVNVALLAFPQGMAYAMIAGLPISFGLFGAAAASIVGPIFAGSRFINLGPTNATAVLMLSAFLAAGTPAGAIAALVPLLLIMVGALQIVAAHLNVANLVSYISRSVIIGYITAAAALIVVNQTENLLGLAVPDAPTLLASLFAIARNIGSIDGPTAVVSAVSAGIYLAWRRFAPRLPAVALTLLSGSGLAWLAAALGFPVATLPAVSAGDWNLTLPRIDFSGMNNLASAALAIAFLGVLEAVSIGKSLAARAGESLRTNQEVFALGMANLASAFGGGMAASGSLTRSVLSVASGAVTPLSSVLCGALLLAMVAGLGGLVAYVPRATLATVVVFVALSLINRRQIRFVVRSTSGDAVVFFVTAGSALVFPLDFAIFIGTATSIVLFLRQAGEPDLVEYAFNREGHLTEVSNGDARPLPEISIVHVEGSLFFGASELLHEQIRRACEDPNLRIIILRLKNAHHLDASAILALEELVRFMRENQRGLIVSGARAEVVQLCRTTGLLELIGHENFFPEWPQNPTLATRNALRRAQQILGQKEASVRVFSEMRTKPATPGPEA